MLVSSFNLSQIIQLHALSLLQKKSVQIRDQFFLYMDQSPVKRSSAGLFLSQRFSSFCRRSFLPGLSQIFFSPVTEGIECFIEDKAFLRLYDMAPVSSPIPFPLSPVNKLDRRHTGRLRKRDNLLTGGGGGIREWGRSRIIRLRESLVLYK